MFLQYCVFVWSCLCFIGLSCVLVCQRQLSTLVDNKDLFYSSLLIDMFFCTQKFFIHFFLLHFSRPIFNIIQNFWSIPGLFLIDRTFKVQNTHSYSSLNCSAVLSPRNSVQTWKHSQEFELLNLYSHVFAICDMWPVVGAHPLRGHHLCSSVAAPSSLLLVLSQVPRFLFSGFCSLLGLWFFYRF